MQNMSYQKTPQIVVSTQSNNLNNDYKVNSYNSQNLSNNLNQNNLNKVPISNNEVNVKMFNNGNNLKWPRSSCGCCDSSEQCQYCVFGCVCPICSECWMSCRASNELQEHPLSALFLGCCFRAGWVYRYSTARQRNWNQGLCQEWLIHTFCHPCSFAQYMSSVY